MSYSFYHKRPSLYLFVSVFPSLSLSFSFFFSFAHSLVLFLFLASCIRELYDPVRRGSREFPLSFYIGRWPTPSSLCRVQEPLCAIQALKLFLCLRVCVKRVRGVVNFDPIRQIDLPNSTRVQFVPLPRSPPIDRFYRELLTVSIVAEPFFYLLTSWYVDSGKSRDASA